jgi:signal transduction histidine kinase
MSETSVREGSTQRTSLRERQDAVAAGAVTIVADCGSCADAVRAALADGHLGPEVAGVEVGTAAGIRGPVLSVAESLDRIDRELVVSAVDRDFLLLERVPQELASRVALLNERSARKRARTLDADRLRSETIGLMWEVHTAESIAELAERVTAGARRVLNVHAAAVVIPADPDDRDGSATPLLWRSPGGDSPDLLERVAAFAARRATESAASAPAPGWPREKPVIDLVSEEDSDLVRDLFDRRTRRVMLVPIEFENCGTGALLLADDAAQPARTSLERFIVSWIATQVGRAAFELWMRDRQERNEQELQETSAKLKKLVDEMGDLSVVVRSIADAVNVGVLFYDTENHPVLHNRMVERLLGLTGFDPATGRSEHVYASDRRTRVKQDKNIISETLEGDQRGLIYWVGDPRGEQRAIVTEAHSITRSNGERLGSAVVTYDVTDLANAIEIREEYLATVSHELRTPLTSIVGYMDLIDDGYDVDSLGFAKEFRNIQRSATQMLTLIRDLLSTSTNELALRIEPIDLSALLTQSVATIKPTVDAARQTLRIEMPPSTVLAHLDGARIKQVVDNLISNAAKYTPEGGTITVTLERADDTVSIAVADDGRGISKTDQARLFDRFFRTRDVREEAIQGVGIGLTIVKTIVDAHGGTILVESEPGRGSTFTVRLPTRAGSTPLPTLPMEP